MRGIVGDVKQSGADELSIERRQQVACAALLREHRFACDGTPGCQVYRSSPGSRGCLLAVEPLGEGGDGLDYEFARHQAMVDTAKLGADDLERSGLQRSEIEGRNEPWDCGRFEPDLGNPKLVNDVGGGD